MQRARDAKKDAVLAAAGVPIDRHRGIVPGEQIRETVLKALRGTHHPAHRLKEAAGGPQGPVQG